MAKGRTLNIQTLHLGPTGSAIKFNETVLPLAGQLGQDYEQDGDSFRLVQHNQGAGAVATVDGGTAYWKDKANHVVTADSADAEGIPNGVAGGYHVAGVTHLNHCFIQVSGDQAAVITSAAGAVGAQLSGSATLDNQLVPTAAGTPSVNLAVGIQLDARGNHTSDNGAVVANSVKCRWLFAAGGIR